MTQAILLMGAILSNVQADEADDERRELERLVAQASAKKKAGKSRKSKDASPLATPAPDSKPASA